MLYPVDRAQLRIGRICLIAAIVLMIIEIVVTGLPDGARKAWTAQEMLAIYARNPLMGMRNLGLINILATSLMLPVIVVITSLHAKHWLARLTMIVFACGYAIFMATNTAFPMLTISQNLAADPANQTLYHAAAATLLAVGTSHTAGTFLGFILIDIADLLLCALILVYPLFRKRTAIVGIVALSFLVAFDILSSFVPALFDAAMALAAIGGIGALIWYGLLWGELRRASRLALVSSPQ